MPAAAPAFQGTAASCALLRADPLRLLAGLTLPALHPPPHQEKPDPRHRLVADLSDEEAASDYEADVPAPKVRFNPNPYPNAARSQRGDGLDLEVAAPCALGSPFATPESNAAHGQPGPIPRNEAPAARVSPRCIYAFLCLLLLIEQ